MEKIGMKFNTSSMLDMLCSSLYDTPLVLLRENLQNAYDAILMRLNCDPSYKNPIITICILGNKIVVTDNGIGMTEQEVKENFWTAGKSGKNTEEAKAAGVIGTFGIGAFANFGVCDVLELETQKIDTIEKCVCKAYKDKLNDDIELCTSVNEDPSYGTTISITTCEGKEVSEQDAIKYLEPYVRYIDIPVYINEKLISCDKYKDVAIETSMLHYSKIYNGLQYEFDFNINIYNLSPIKGRMFINNIVINKVEHAGDILLDTDQPVIWGLRNGFGLSTVPINSSYNFGGLVNLMMLVPTAGREAICKTSITKVQQIINIAETLYTEFVALKKEADTYREFLQYVNNHFKISLAINIKIQLANFENSFVTLGSLMKEKDNIKYYNGADVSILKKYASSDLQIVVVSKDSPRRLIQKRFLNEIGIIELEDRVEVSKYEYINLNYEYFIIGNSIQRIIKSDYLISNNEVFFADISHGVHFYVENENNKVIVYIKKDDKEIANYISICKSSYGVFEDVLKDYVRNNIYPQISQYIPTSKKEGIVAFCNLLKKQNETFSIFKEDTADIDESFNLFKEGKITIDEFTSKVNRMRNVTQQTVNKNNIKPLEEVLPSIQVSTELTNATSIAQNREINAEPLPPILRLDVTTKAKLLITDNDSFILHGYKKFLTFTEKMIEGNYSFFYSPHTTKVIWSTHRIIYIFSLRAGYYTIYYDMKLQTHLDSDLTGGEQLQTTTIITKDKIFVPIPHALEDYFSLHDGPLNFSIHYDRIEGEDISSSDSFAQE